jgi:hypothetical protein
MVSSSLAMRIDMSYAMDSLFARCLWYVDMIPYWHIEMCLHFHILHDGLIAVSLSPVSLFSPLAPVHHPACPHPGSPFPEAPAGRLESLQSAR